MIKDVSRDPFAIMAHMVDLDNRVTNVHNELSMSAGRANAAGRLASEHAEEAAVSLAAVKVIMARAAEIEKRVKNLEDRILLRLGQLEEVRWANELLAQAVDDLAHRVRTWDALPVKKRVKPVVLF